MQGDITKYQIIADTLEMDFDEYCEYMIQRVLALEKQLKESQSVLQEVSEISTAKVRDISVIINDPVFLNPISNLEKTY